MQLRSARRVNPDPRPSADDLPKIHKRIALWRLQDRLGRKLLDSLYRIDRLRTELGVAIIPDCDCLRRALLARQIQFLSHEKVREHNLACPHCFATVGTQHPDSATRKCIMKLE